MGVCAYVNSIKSHLLAHMFYIESIKSFVRTICIWVIAGCFISLLKESPNSKHLLQDGSRVIDFKRETKSQHVHIV